MGTHLIVLRVTYPMNTNMTEIRSFSVNVNVVQVNLDMTDSMGPGKLVCHMQNPSYTYDVCTNTCYASDWDQAYRPSYAKICCTVARPFQVHLYTVCSEYS